MSYTKTTWVNNTTPINDTNLNKIEQGIYDNSLVVDAVTNTLNPTDTETYKTAELTEGQITDAIGVGDVELKGQTEQDGTPTPSAPVDVNVVSGSNVIGIYNKNIINVENFETTAYGITVTKKGNVWEINGTATANNTFKLIPIIQSTLSGQYALTANYISGTKSGTANFNLRDNTSDSALFNVNLTTSNTTNTATLNNKVKYGIYIASGATFNNYKFSPQLEVGGTSTTYEPHQGKELHLDLGKNLFNEDNYLANTGINSDGTIATSNNNSLFYIPIKYGKKYTISFVDNGVSGNILYGFSNDKPVLNGTCTYNVLDITTLNNHTFTPVNANNKYLCIRLNVVNTNQYQAMENIQVELGSEATKYVPYDPNPIELCKIGDYQDYFYKSGSKWYLHKEIGKDVVDENSTISITNTGTSNWFYQIVPNPRITTKLQTNQLCNYYVNGQIASGNTENGILKIMNGEIRIRYGTEDTVANFKTWLASNNVLLYYILETATDTEITDTTLIFQLEAIYNAPLYEETNITQTNNDLPMVLDITACKDNINGIKAFIRK